VVDNLLDNALAACPAGSTVTVAVEPGVLTVDDDGPGMTDEQLARATDRFWRAPGAPAGGTGLGLSIVEQLVARSGGRLRLGHRPGGGLRVRVELPVAERAELTPASPPARP